MLEGVEADALRQLHHADVVGEAGRAEAGVGDGAQNRHQDLSLVLVVSVVVADADEYLLDVLVADAVRRGDDKLLGDQGAAAVRVELP